MHGKIKGSELAIKGDRVVAICGEIVRASDATDDPDKVTCINCRIVISKNVTSIHKWLGKRPTKPVKVKLDWEPTI